MRLPLYQVDAFAAAVFEGNPAAVCPLPEWLEDSVLQAIAAENNLSETAFFLPGRDEIPLRWFTPTEEVPLCGHATLAAGFIVLDVLEPDRSSVRFESLSGPLTVQRDGNGFSLDLPRVPLSAVDRCPGEVSEGLGVEPTEVLISTADPNYVAILESEESVRNLRPDLHVLERLHPYGVAVSARGSSVDFVSRYFAPGYGIDEDPVTGSIHCALAPYWGERLGRQSLRAAQLSPRGGVLRIRLDGSRVHLWGQAVLYLSGEIVLD